MKINQCSRVLNELMRFGSIDHVKAKRLGVKSLPARIKELRDLGLKIAITKGRYSLGVKRRAVKRERFEDDLFPNYNQDE